MAQATIILDAECCLAHVGPLIVGLWRGAVTEEALSAHHMVARALRRQYRGFGMLVVIESKAPAPSAEKSMLESLYREIEPNLFGLAQVIHGEGFRLGAVRAVMASLLHERTFPRQTFSDLHLASAWLVSLALEKGISVPRADVAEAIENVYWAYSWQPGAVRPFPPKL